MENLSHFPGTAVSGRRVPLSAPGAQLDSLSRVRGQYGVTGWLGVAVVLLLLFRMLRDAVFYNAKAAPHVPSPVPFFGNIVAFGERSVDARTHFRPAPPPLAVSFFSAKIVASRSAPQPTDEKVRKAGTCLNGPVRPLPSRPRPAGLLTTARSTSSSRRTNRCVSPLRLDKWRCSLP